MQKNMISREVLPSVHFNRLLCLSKEIRIEIWLHNFTCRSPLNVCDTITELFHQNEDLSWRMSAAGCNSGALSCPFVGRRWVWWHLNLKLRAGREINSQSSDLNSSKLSELKYHNLWPIHRYSRSVRSFRISRRSIHEIKTNFHIHVSLSSRKRIYNNKMYQFRSYDCID